MKPLHGAEHYNARLFFRAFLMLSFTTSLFLRHQTSCFWYLRSFLRALAAGMKAERGVMERNEECGRTSTYEADRLRSCGRRP